MGNTMIDRKMIEIETDVCVMGGGMAALCAALAAARHGASVALVHDRPVLGGNASSEIRMHICGADWINSCWRETGIIEELRIESLVNNDEHNVSIQDLAFYDAVRRQPGLTAWLNARVVECTARCSRVISCTADELTSERRLRFHARQFVDATGDGGPAALAGAAFRKGREGRDEFGESLAPLQPDNSTLGHSILFQARDVGRPVPFVPPPWALKFESDADLPGRPHNKPFGYWWLEWGGTLDTIDDSEAITRELLAAALGVWDHMKNRGDHGFANYALTWLGFLPGRRESRRFIGDHILTEDDVTSARQFPDQIAYGGWAIDHHPAEGFRSPEPACKQIGLKRPFGIPLRSCYCRGFENLFLAGRHISATHVAFGSTRVMATCAAVGHGVGIAAALAARKGITPQEVAADRIGEVQQRLLADGAFLLDIRNADPADLAADTVVRRTAAVTASSSSAGFPAERITDGSNHPEPEDPHAWHSDAAAGFPAWVELRWPRPVKLQRVQVVLDTDFTRPLRLSQDPDEQRWCRDWRQSPAVPRATTLRDFRLQVEGPGGWETVAECRGNYQRLARFAFEPVCAAAMRLVAESAWGVNYASVLEIRCGA